MEPRDSEVAITGHVPQGRMLPSARKHTPYFPAAFSSSISCLLPSSYAAQRSGAVTIVLTTKPKMNIEASVTMIFFP